MQQFLDHLKLQILKWLYVACVFLAIGCLGYGAFIIVAQAVMWIQTGAWAGYSMQQLLWEQQGYWFTSTGMLGLDKIIRWFLGVHPTVYLWLGAFVIFMFGILLCLMPYEDLEVKMAQKKQGNVEVKDTLAEQLEAFLKGDGKA